MCWILFEGTDVFEPDLDQDELVGSDPAPASNWLALHDVWCARGSRRVRASQHDLKECGHAVPRHEAEVAPGQVSASRCFWIMRERRGMACSTLDLAMGRSLS